MQRKAIKNYLLFCGYLSSNKFSNFTPSSMNASLNEMLIASQRDFDVSSNILFSCLLLVDALVTSPRICTEEDSDFNEFGLMLLTEFSLALASKAL